MAVYYLQMGQRFHVASVLNPTIRLKLTGFACKNILFRMLPEVMLHQSLWDPKLVATKTTFILLDARMDGHVRLDSVTNKLLI